MAKDKAKETVPTYELRSTSVTPEQPLFWNPRRSMCFVHPSICKVVGKKYEVSLAKLQTSVPPTIIIVRPFTGSPVVLLFSFGAADYFLGEVVGWDYVSPNSGYTLRVSNE